MFCKNGSTKKDAGYILNDNLNNLVNSKDNKTNFLLSNLIVFLLFIINECSLFLGITNSLFNSVINSSSSSGFFLIFIPFFAGIFAMPQFIGVILSGINLKIKNYIMLIFIFIVSIVSLMTTLYSSSSSTAGNNGILFWICLISNILLCIIILLKLILKIKK